MFEIRDEVLGGLRGGGDVLGRAGYAVGG